MRGLLKGTLGMGMPGVSRAAQRGLTCCFGSIFPLQDYRGVGRVTVTTTATLFLRTNIPTITMENKTVQVSERALGQAVWVGHPWSFKQFQC